MSPRLTHWLPALAILPFVAASACENLPESDDPLSPPAVAEIPTFIEHLDADGAVVELTPPAVEWDGAYPIRIVRRDEFGGTVSEEVLTRPPPFDLAETIKQMTPAQRDKMERMLKAVASKMPESKAGLALDEVRKIRGRQK